MAVPTVSSIAPAQGPTNVSNVTITNLAGTNFIAGATVKFTKTAHSDINATNVVVVSGTKITCDFNLSGAALGFWIVTVTTSGGSGSFGNETTTGFMIATAGCLGNDGSFKIPKPKRNIKVGRGTAGTVRPTSGQLYPRTA